MNALVGYTGFVGSNLYESGSFDSVFNSKNISDAFGTNPDLLVYSGLRAEKYLANNNPSMDMDNVCVAEDNISKINPKRLVLISTIDVFKTPYKVNEKTPICTNGLQPYGFNRYQLELWVRDHYPDALIVRLPALFGKNIKKNFIYDLINVIPSMLREEKYLELVAIEPILKDYFHKQDNGFYKVKCDDFDREELKNVFLNIGFSAVNFTDSRSKYQYYNLKRLWQDIHIALDEGLRLWHPATEPVSASELYLYITGKEFRNELSGVPANYDYRTIYEGLYGGKNGYICDKEQVMNEIRDFVL